MRWVWIFSILLIVFGASIQIARYSPGGPRDLINGLITANPEFRDARPNQVFVPMGDTSSAGNFRVRTGRGAIFDRRDDTPYATFDVEAPKIVAPFTEFEISAEIGPILADVQSSTQKFGDNASSSSIPRLEQMRVELQGAGVKIVNQSRDWLAVSDKSNAKWVWIVSTEYVGTIDLNFLIEGREQRSTGQHVEQIGIEKARIVSQNGWYSAIGSWLGPFIDLTLVKMGKYADGLAFWAVAFGLIGSCYAFFRTIAAKVRAAAGSRLSQKASWFPGSRKRSNADVLAAALIEPPSQETK